MRRGNADPAGVNKLAFFVPESGMTVLRATVAGRLMRRGKSPLRRGIRAIGGNTQKDEAARDPAPRAHARRGAPVARAAQFA
jgi:hypothetical protein